MTETNTLLKISILILTFVSMGVSGCHGLASPPRESLAVGSAGVSPYGPLPLPKDVFTHHAIVLPAPPIKVPEEPGDPGDPGEVTQKNFEPSGGDAPLGWGWNTLTSKVRGKCVTTRGHDAPVLTTSLPPGSAEGQQKEYHLEQITDSRSLEESLGITAQVSFGVGIFKSDARFTYLSSRSFHQFSNYLYVSVHVVNSTVRVDDPVLSEFAKGLGDHLSDGCGNEYIAALQTGGDFTAIVEFSSDTAKDQTTTAASLSVTVGAFGGGQGEFTSALSTLSAHTSVKITLISSGGTENIPDLATLREKALAFPSTVRAGNSADAGGGGIAPGHPWIVSAITSDYATVGGVREPVDSLGAEEDYLSFLATRRNELLQLRNSLWFASTHLNEFSGSRASLEADANKAQAVIDLINTAANACLRAPASACTADHAAFAIPNDIVRPLRADVSSIVNVPVSDTWDTLDKSGAGGRVRAQATCPADHPKLVECVGWSLFAGLKVKNPAGGFFPLNVCDAFAPGCTVLSVEPFRLGFVAANVNMRFKEQGTNYCACNVNVPPNIDSTMRAGPIATASVTAVCSD